MPFPGIPYPSLPAATLIQQEKQNVSEPDDKPKSLNDPKRDTYLITDNQPPLILTGYLTGTISDTGAILKLELLCPPEGRLEVLTICMSRSQCSELGNALSRLAVLPYRPDQKPS